MCVTGSESPVVVVLFGSMELGFKRFNPSSKEGMEKPKLSFTHIIVAIVLVGSYLICESMAIESPQYTVLHLESNFEISRLLELSPKFEKDPKGAGADAGSDGFGVEGGAGNSASDVATSSLRGGIGNTLDGHERSSEEDENGSPGNKKEEQQRDVEMEDAITAELQSRDAFSDYEIDVTKEVKPSMST